MRKQFIQNSGSAQHCGAQARLHFVEFYSVYLNENLKYYDELMSEGQNQTLHAILLMYHFTI